MPTKEEIEQTITRITSISEALSNESRLKILMILAKYDGDISVQLLATYAGLKPAITSHHLSALHRAGLVSQQRQGQYVVYTLERGGIDKYVKDFSTLELSSKPTIVHNEVPPEQVCENDTHSL